MVGGGLSQSFSHSRGSSVRCLRTGKYPSPEQHTLENRGREGERLC